MTHKEVIAFAESSGLSVKTTDQSYVFYSEGKKIVSIQKATADKDTRVSLAKRVEPFLKPAAPVARDYPTDSALEEQESE